MIQVIEEQPVSDDWYTTGDYNVDFGDDAAKAGFMIDLMKDIPDLPTPHSYADVGCGNGGVFARIHKHLAGQNTGLSSVGYDLLPEEKLCREVRDDRNIEFRRMLFSEDNQSFDLVTLNDVIEHVTEPRQFLQAVARRARYVALHIPLDDRLSVLLADQLNFRLKDVGHISFFNPCSALNLLTDSGLQPLHCKYTPGFMAPSGRERTVQKVAYGVRRLAWSVSPALMALTIGGVSLAVMCRGELK